MIPRDEPCTCCGAPKPAEWEDIVDSLIDGLPDNDYRVEFTDTGGGCKAIAISPAMPTVDQHGAHLLLTAGGPLMPTRQEDLAEAANEIRERCEARDGPCHCDEADEEIDPSAFPSWELGFYDCGGEQQACINLQTTIHPANDELLAAEIAGLLLVARAVTPRGWSN